MKNSLNITIQRGANLEPQPFSAANNSGASSSEVATLHKENDGLKRDLKRVEKIQRRADLENARELKVMQGKLDETTKLFEDGRNQHWELQRQNVRTSVHPGTLICLSSLDYLATVGH